MWRVEISKRQTTGPNYAEIVTRKSHLGPILPQSRFSCAHSSPARKYKLEHNHGRLIRKEAKAMKKKNRKPTAAGRKSCRPMRDEKKAVKKFNADLQKEIDGVDWAKVKLSRIR
jgi:hypothetical protein